MARNRKVEDDDGHEVSLSAVAKQHRRGGYEISHGYLDEVPELMTELINEDLDEADQEGRRFAPVDFSAQVHNVRPQQQIHQSPAAQKRTTQY